MAKRIIYLLCLSGVFSLVPRVFADITMYSDVNGICPGYCHTVPSNGGCCSENNIVRQITKPTKSGQVFVGYTQSSDASEYGIDSSSLVVSSKGAVKSNTLSYVNHSLYAVWTPECQPTQTQNLASCDVATDDNGEVLVENGQVQYQTECSSGYTYDAGTNQNSATASCHADDGQNSDEECSLNSPEACTTRELCTYLGRYGYHWCWVDGAEKCYLPASGETPCCEDKASVAGSACTSRESCESMWFFWENNTCKQKVVYYACGKDLPKKQGYETAVRQDMFLPKSIKTVCAKQAYAESGYEFVGWKVRGTDEILQSANRQPYTWNTSSIILEAQWNSCDADHPDLCITRQSCEQDNKYWCTNPADAPSEKWKWACSANMGTQCCYNSPNNCEYAQCQYLNYVWELDENPANAHCQVSGTDYVLYQFFSTIDNEYNAGYVGKLGDYRMTSGLGSAVPRIRKKKGITESNVYLLSDWESDTSSWGHYRSQQQYIRLTRNPYLPGHTFKGYYDAENGTGIQHIDANGNFKSIALNSDTYLYPYFTEDDHTEPSNGLIKLYLSACQMGDYCDSFTKFTDGTPIPEDDPLLHQGQYYGPVYYSGNVSAYSNNDKFYTDANGNNELPHGLPLLTGEYVFKTWMTRDLSFYASDYEFMSPLRHYDIKTFGPNNNRAILSPSFYQSNP